MKFYSKIILPFVVVVAVIFNACVNETNNTKQQTKTEQKASADSVLLDSLNELISVSPNVASHYAQRSAVYNNLGKLTLSINDMTKANELDSLNIDYMVSLSDKYLQFGKSQVTRKLLLKAESIEPDNVEVLYRLGNLYFYVQDHKQAFSYLRKAQAVDPFHAPSYFTMGMIYKERGDTTKAIENFQIAVERESKYYDAYIVLAALYSGLGNEIAIDYYNNALQILPLSYEAAYGKAMFYQQNEKPEEAIKEYSTMLVGNRDRFQHVYFNLGYIEMIFYNEYNTAIAYFDSAINIQPNYAAAFSNRGYCFENLNKFDEAKANYSKALEIIPDLEVAKQGLMRVN